jgi:hypothetical protein
VKNGGREIRSYGGEKLKRKKGKGKITCINEKVKERVRSEWDGLGGCAVFKRLARRGPAKAQRREEIFFGGKKKATTN